MPIETVAEFILYIAPGFIAMYMFNSQFPTKEQDSFTKVSLSLLFGVFLTTSLKWFDKNCLNYFLYTNTDSMPGMRFIISLFFWGFIFGWILIGLRELLYNLLKQYKWNYFFQTKETVWNRVTSKDNLDWALLFLKDDSIYFGWIDFYDYDPNKDSQGILLTDVTKVNKDMTKKYDIEGYGMYIETVNISHIEFHKGNIFASK